MEKDFRRKIDMLNKHLRSEQEDEDYLTPLAHAIFNCTTIEEIFEIKNLIESYRVNELTNKHYKTLQNMFLSLSYGVLPICQPQRDTITDSQRELVGKIQNSSFNTAKEVLKENRVFRVFTRGLYNAQRSERFTVSLRRSHLALFSITFFHGVDRFPRYSKRRERGCPTCLAP